MVFAFGPTILMLISFRANPCWQRGRAPQERRARSLATVRHRPPFVRARPEALHTVAVGIDAVGAAQRRLAAPGRDRGVAPMTKACRAAQSRTGRGRPPPATTPGQAVQRCGRQRRLVRLPRRQRGGERALARPRPLRPWCHSRHESGQAPHADRAARHRPPFSRRPPPCGAPGRWCRPRTPCRARRPSPAPAPASTAAPAHRVAPSNACATTARVPRARCATWRRSSTASG